jgi:hypothetical protein
LLVRAFQPCGRARPSALWPIAPWHRPGRTWALFSVPFPAQPAAWRRGRATRPRSKILEISPNGVVICPLGGGTRWSSSSLPEYGNEVMDTLSLPGTCVFDRFCFDDGRGVLFRRSDDGQLVKINLGSRALAVLGVLVDGSDELVSKDEIMGAVWPGTAVEDANLTVQISSLRRILDAERPDGSCIQTVSRRFPQPPLFRTASETSANSDRTDATVSHRVTPVAFGQDGAHSMQ